MLDLTPIKARRDAATPGPWHLTNYDHSGGRGPARVYKGTNEEYGEPQSMPNTEADHIFVAHAPTDIAALIEEVERVRAENEALKEKEKRLVDVAMSEVNFWSKADIEAIDPEEALNYWIEVLKEAQS